VSGSRVAAGWSRDHDEARRRKDLTRAGGGSGPSRRDIRIEPGGAGWSRRPCAYAGGSGVARCDLAALGRTGEQISSSHSSGSWSLTARAQREIELAIEWARPSPPVKRRLSLRAGECWATPVAT